MNGIFLYRQTWRLPRDQILVGYAKIFDERGQNPAEFWDKPPRAGASLETTDFWFSGQDGSDSKRVIYWGQRDEGHPSVSKGARLGRHTAIIKY